MSVQGHASLLSQAKEHLRATDAPAEQWKRLCAFLSGLQARDQASLLEPLEAALASFPTAVRTVCPQWLARQSQGQRVPAMRLSRSLSWSGPRLDEAALRELLSYPDFPQLHRLKLFGQGLGTHVVQAILQAPRLRHLASLNLTSNCINGFGLKALASADSELKLRQLFLGRNQIRDPDTNWLLHTPLSPSLELLCLRDNPLSGDRRRELEDFFYPSSLELRLAVATTKPGIPKRKRGKPSKKKPPTG